MHVSRTWVVGVALLAVCSSGGCAGSKTSSPSAKEVRPKPVANLVPRALQESDWFEDVTAETGVQAIYHSGQEAKLYTILETVGGGVAGLDFDQDGDLDLFFPGGGKLLKDPPQVQGLPSKLYRNEGDWKFVDVTQEMGLNHAGDYSHGCAVNDFNRDGWPDVFVTCYGESRLYKNESGEKFVDVTQQAGLAFSSWSTAATWGDVNRDGWPDLYVAAYVDWKLNPQENCEDPNTKIRDVCPPQKYAAARDRLFLNQQGNRFEEVTEQANLSKLGKGLGVLAADFNRDGWLDFYVANDSVANHLYLGGPAFPLEEVGQVSGTAFNELGAPEGSMGLDFSDFNGDQRGDVFVTNFEMEDNSLYQHEQGKAFRHATVTSGLAGHSRTYVGFGTGFADFNSDGWQDLVILNGNVFYHRGRNPFEQPALLLKNQNGLSFTDMTTNAGPYFSVLHPGRGIAIADLNNDGGLDLVMIHQDKPAAILKNRQPPTNWVRVQLKGTKSDPFAVGASVSLMEMASEENRTTTQFVRGGAGYLSHFDLRLVFPLSEEQQTVSVTVTWPNGASEHFANLPVKQTCVLTEGTGQSGPE